VRVKIDTTGTSEAGVYRFIAQQNIAHFEDLLRTETDPKRHAVLLKLLIAEEKMLGQYCSEHLAQVDGHIETQPLIGTRVAE
jgi:hypothetical protein